MAVGWVIVGVLAVGYSLFLLYTGKFTLWEVFEHASIDLALQFLWGLFVIVGAFILGYKTMAYKCGKPWMSKWKYRQIKDHE
jgi:hypothetical protein